jgi:hypothetical protein
VVIIFMSIETRQNPATGTMDIRHPESGMWVPAIADLQTAGGKSVKLILEQEQLLKNAIAALSPLPDLLKAQKEHKEVVNTVVQAIARLQVSLASISQSQSEAAMELSGIGVIVEGAVTALNTNTETLSSLVGKISSFPESLSSIQKGIEDLNTLSTQLKSIEDALGNKGLLATGRISRAVAIAANQEVPFPLPNGTKKLSFKVRRNNLGRSFDLRHSLAPGGIVEQNYETLWAFNEYSESGLLLNEASLYFWCDTAVTVEISIWY